MWLGTAWLQLLAQHAHSRHSPGDTASLHVASLELSPPLAQALLAPSSAATPTLGSAAQLDPAAFQPCCAPVSPQKPIHFCGCLQSSRLDDAAIRVQACFFFLSLLLVVQPATGDRQRLPNCILHLFISKCAFVRCKRRPHYWL